MSDYLNSRNSLLMDPGTPGLVDGDTVTLTNGSKFVRVSGCWEPVGLGAASKQQPVLATPSEQGPRTQVLGIDTGISLILPASVLSAPVPVTGVTTEQVLHSFVVPKECHGLTTRLTFALLASMTNNANAKTFRIRIGSSVGASTIIAQSAPANANTLSVPRFQLRNRNSRAVQVSPFTLSLAAGTSSTAPSKFAIDFTVDQTVFVTVQLASGADMAILEDFEMAFGG